ncbi:MAG: S-layer homology domain-containing protein [Bacillota bacterium]|nr:S-layer homology domain-containing protein [Bacillota bacterium]
MKSILVGLVLAVLLMGAAFITSYADAEGTTEATTQATSEGTTEEVSPEVTSETSTQASSTEEKPPHLHLLDHGIITGDENGDLLLEKFITRTEMSIVLIRMIGQEDIAKAFSTQTGFADDAAVPGWGKSFVAYARQHGLMSGDEFGVFNPMGKISGEELAILVRRILGYTEKVNWLENIKTLQRETGIVVPEKDILLRSEVFAVLWNAFSQDVKMGGGSLMNADSGSR